MEATLELIQANGYSGTGLNAINAHAGTPKGSLYFHFPDGKEALGEEAVHLAAERFSRMIQAIGEHASSPGVMVATSVALLASMIEGSDYRLGCPVSVVALEMGADSVRLRAACAAAYQSWIDPLEDLLVSYGHPQPVAHSLATTAISTIEGAIIIARARRDVEPLHLAGRVMAELLDRVSVTIPDEG